MLCSLCCVNYVVFTMLCSLCCVHYVVFTKLCSLCCVHYVVLTMLCSLCCVHYAVFTMLCSLSCVHYAALTMLCSLCFFVSLHVFVISYGWAAYVLQSLVCSKDYYCYYIHVLFLTVSLPPGYDEALDFPNDSNGGSITRSRSRPTRSRSATRAAHRGSNAPNWARLFSRSVSATEPS